MNLIKFISRLGPGPLRRLLAWALLSAAASAGVLAVVNTAARNIADRRSDVVELWWCAAFVLCLVIYAIAESRMVAMLTADVETAVDASRTRMLDRLSRAALWKLERWNRVELFDSVTRNCRLISMNSQFLALTVRSAMLTIAVLIYIASVSLAAFLFIGGLLTLGAIVHRRLDHGLEDCRRAAIGPEAEMFDHVSDLFDGFKEQRLNSARGRALAEGFAAASAATTEARSELHLHRWQQFVFGETAFNLMLGMVVFVVPALSSGFAKSVDKVTAAVLFMATPVFGLMQTVMIMGEAEAAAGAMMDLEERLEGLIELGSEPERDRPDGAPPAPPGYFSEIRFDGVEFSFPAPEGERPFRVGPIDLVLHRGETVFITGGNGSGKSTLIKLLTGLYRPDRGVLSVDGRPVLAGEETALRERMAAVFSDFHLFPRLYGVDPEIAKGPRGAELLEEMEMDRTARIIDGERFDRRDLSVGQRKRLGMIAALLEHKPILILDEWAADQDPHFRKTFYRDFLPGLKFSGMTVIAVTHDDHYFDAADRRLRMEDGHLFEEAVDAPLWGARS
ncbi:MAG: ATP-binding cassette domain-containing protein [Ancalomicrobiaceae bacterium]|nr:ATP-binding cassette domain-containing protein [Ancalomicrobiaceae bacterium]